jgi:hypothetical protein
MVIWVEQLKPRIWSKRFFKSMKQWRDGHPSHMFGTDVCRKGKQYQPTQTVPSLSSFQCKWRGLELGVVCLGPWETNSIANGNGSRWEDKMDTVPPTPIYYFRSWRNRNNLILLYPPIIIQIPPFVWISILFFLNWSDQVFFFFNFYF